MLTAGLAFALIGCGSSSTEVSGAPVRLPVQEPAPEPDPEPTPDPEPAPEPVQQPVRQPVRQPVNQPVNQPDNPFTGIPSPRAIDNCGDEDSLISENCANHLNEISSLGELSYTLDTNWADSNNKSFNGLDRSITADIISKNDVFNPSHSGYEFQYKDDIALTKKIEVTYYKEYGFIGLYSYKGESDKIEEDVTLKATFYNPQLKRIAIEGYIGGDDGITMASTNFGQIRFSVNASPDENGQFTDSNQVRFSNISIRTEEDFSEVRGSFKNDGSATSFPTQVVGELEIKRFFDTSPRPTDPEEYNNNLFSRGDNALAGVFVADKTSEITRRLVPITPEKAAFDAYNAIKLESGERVYPRNGFTRDRSDREANRVRVEGKTLSFSGNIGIQNRYGWAGRKYELTEANGKVYETYMYIDDPTGVSYTSYGYWTKKDSTGDLEKTRVFAIYNVPSGTFNRGVPDLSPLSGTATFSGEAVGYFARKGSKPDSGSFTANATLTANFDTNMIKGTIDNFSGPTTSLWSVELKETAVGNTHNYDRGEFTRTETVLTIDGVEGGSGGRWDGEMVGTHPTGGPRDIVGAFYSEHSGANAVITGGFAAEKQ